MFINQFDLGIDSVLILPTFLCSDLHMVTVSQENKIQNIYTNGEQLKAILYAEGNMATSQLVIILDAFLSNIRLAQKQDKTSIPSKVKEGRKGEI